MLEPTDEQISAFKKAWEAEDDQQIQKLAAGPYMPNPGDRTRAGLRAVLTPLKSDLENRIIRCAPINMELRHDGTEDREAAAYVEGVHAAYDAVLEFFKESDR